MKHRDRFVYRDEFYGHYYCQKKRIGKGRDRGIDGWGVRRERNKDTWTYCPCDHKDRVEKRREVSYAHCCLFKNGKNGRLLIRRGLRTTVLGASWTIRITIPRELLNTERTFLLGGQGNISSFFLSLSCRGIVSFSFIVVSVNSIPAK